MEDLLQVVRYVNTGVYVLVAAAAFKGWRRQGGASSAWVAAAFATLAFILLQSLVIPDGAKGVFAQVVSRLTGVGVVFFPYALYRFTASLKRPSALVDRIATGSFVVVVAWALLSDPFSDASERRSPADVAFLLALVLEFGGLLLTVAVRLWRAGARQPAVARLRMRLLSAASMGITLALVFAVGQEDDSNVVSDLVSQLLALTAVVFFFIGFAPPALLRVAWRRRDQEALRQATERLVSATSAQDVIDNLLPHVTTILGARAAILVAPDGAVIGSFGEIPENGREVAAGSAVTTPHHVEPDLLRLEFDFGSLVIWASPYTPFFGQEEVELLRSLGVLTGLALDRTKLFRSEQEARASAEQANQRIAAALSNEREMRRSLEQLNAEMETFVYTVSHDLNSPIIAIQGFSEFLSKDFGDVLPEKGRFYMERILVSATYLQSLIKDLLSFSRIGRVQTVIEDVSLDDIVRQAADEVRGNCPDLQVEAGDSAIVRMNPLRARQLFTNLMQNSCRYSGRPDTRIVIRCTPIGEDRIRISIRDNGPGIAKEHRARVFGVFERLQESGPTEGSGMGLPICKKIVETAGGSMWIEESEQGLDVQFSLPLASAAAKAVT